MKRIEEIFREIAKWKIKHPDALFHKVKMIPVAFAYVIESIADNGTYNGIEKTFYIHTGALRKENVSTDQYKIIRRYLDATYELRSAEEEFIKMFTAEEPYIKLLNKNEIKSQIT